MRGVVLLTMSLLWQVSAAAAPTCCSMREDAGSLVSIYQDAAKHLAHEVKGHADDEHQSRGNCCGTEISGSGCLMPGCALPIQLVTPTMIARGASSIRSTGIAFYPVVYPRAPVFPLLRPPIA